MTGKGQSGLGGRETCKDYLQVRDRAAFTNTATVKEYLTVADTATQKDQ